MDRKWSIIPDWNNLDESVRIAKEYNAAFEYNDFYNPTVYMDEEETERRIQKYLSIERDRSMDTVHGVFYDTAFNSTDPVIRNHCMNLMRQDMSIAKRLGCRGVVFHTGIISGLKLKSYQNGWLVSMEKIYREICAEFPNIDFYLENTTEQDPELIVQMAERMKDVSNFKLCIDYAHCNLTSTSVEEWCLKMGPYVGHVHLNDNDGIQDLHAVCGTESINYEKFARLSERYFKDAPVLLEITGAEKSEQALKFMNDVVLQEEVVQASEEITLTVEQCMNALETNLLIAKEKNKTALLNLILNKIMDVTHCDAGTLYVLEEDGLHFRIMKTRTMGVDQGGDGTPINLPPVKLRMSHVCAYSALTGKTVNIHDVYHCDEFDFSGPKNYDKMTGYLTRSMLSVPLINQNDEILGVMQLLNVVDENGNLQAFDPSLEKIVEIMASQAAVTLQQVNYIDEIRTLIWSFTSALAEAIDQRTPYNGSHTRKVAEYSEKIARHINKLHEQGLTDDYFDDNRREQLVMAALLHDIGKMIVPTAVMNKETRLGAMKDALYDRLKYIRVRYEVDYLKQQLSEEEYLNKKAELDKIFEVVEKIQNAGFVNDELMAELDAVSQLVYKSDEEEIPYFTEEELKSLHIRKGTLTNEERAIMEGHVTMTEKILAKVHFNSDYKMAPIFAAQHHETLNGKGYPRHVKADEIYLESRILAVADICDALLATDRPYKKAMPKEKAFAILHSMVNEGNLEGRLVDYLEECLKD